MKSTLLWIKRLVKYCTCDTQDKRTVSEILLQNKPFQGDAKAPWFCVWNLITTSGFILR